MCWSGLQALPLPDLLSTFIITSTQHRPLPPTVLIPHWLKTSTWYGLTRFILLLGNAMGVSEERSGEALIMTRQVLLLQKCHQIPGSEGLDLKIYGAKGKMIRIGNPEPLPDSGYLSCISLIETLEETCRPPLSHH